MNAIATLDEAVAVLTKELIGDDEVFVRCEVQTCKGDVLPREWTIFILGDWIKSKYRCELFRNPNLSKCVQSALAWYRANRKAVTA